MGAMHAGAQLLANYHDVRISARQVQEIQMRLNVPLSQNDREFSASDPTLAGANAKIHERGAMPDYEGGVPTEPRSSGLPYEDAKTVLMVDEIWKDAMKVRVLVVPSSMADTHVMVIPFSINTTPGKMPDRAISDEVRTIFDLRLPNLFCAKSDYREVDITDIREIAERVIALRRTWPHIKLTCCKRDIDAAFNR